MGLGNTIKNKVMSMQKQRARERNYKIAADEEIKKKADAAYYKAKEERAIQEARDKAKSGTFKDKLKRGIGNMSKRMKENKASPRRHNMGLGSVTMAGGGPEFGLANRSAFDLKVSNKNKKGPFDL